MEITEAIEILDKCMENPLSRNCWECPLFKKTSIGVRICRLLGEAKRALKEIKSESPVL